MHNLFIAEIIKLKRKKILALIVAAFVIDVVIILTTINDGMPQPQFLGLYRRAFTTISSVLHPLIISLIGIYIVSDEYKNDTINHIVTAPVPPAKFVFAKIMILQALTLLLTIAVAVIFGICFILFGEGNSIKLLENVILHLFVNSITFTLAFLPILLIVIIFRSNIIIPIVSLLVFSGVIILKNSGTISVTSNSISEWVLNYLHPLGNASMIDSALTYRFVPNPEVYGIISPDINWAVSLACFLGVLLLSVGFSIVILNRQNH